MRAVHVPTRRGWLSRGALARSLAARAAGWSLALVAIPIGIIAGVLGLLGLVALTENPIVGGIAGLLVLAAVTGGLTVLVQRLRGAVVSLAPLTSFPVRGRLQARRRTTKGVSR